LDDLNAGPSIDQPNKPPIQLTKEQHDKFLNLKSLYTKVHKSLLSLTLYVIEFIKKKSDPEKQAETHAVIKDL
jgi:hypothetical protein